MVARPVGAEDRPDLFLMLPLANLPGVDRVVQSVGAGEVPDGHVVGPAEQGRADDDTADQGFHARSLEGDRSVSPCYQLNGFKIFPILPKSSLSWSKTPLSGSTSASSSGDLAFDATFVSAGFCFFGLGATLSARSRR